MELVFLSARGTPLTKSFSLTEGQVIKHAYPRVHRFTSARETVSSLDSFYKALTKHAQNFDCLLKGNLAEDLHNESRAGKTQRDEPTNWVCLDIDGIPGVADPTDLLQAIPECRGVSTIVQYSSSMGIVPDKGLSAHVFMLLDKPMEPAALKQWLYHLNMSIPMLRDNITLNRLGTTLKWPLDVSTCQNDKLIYIAPPILKDGLKDPYKGKRIELWKGRKTRRLVPDLNACSSTRALDQDRQRLLNALRKEAGYSARSLKTKTVKGVEVSSKPDPIEITDLKEERGFVYMNLNGGDSWAYYHPVTNPDVIYNFKGEPDLATRDISPTYFKQATQRAKEARRELDEQTTQETIEQGEGLLYLGFRAEPSDQYYIGTFDVGRQEANVSPTSNLTKLQHFLLENNQPVPEAVPTWRYEFRFDRSDVFNQQERFINRYQPTALIRTQAQKPVPAIPPVTYKLLTSMLNDADQVLEHFLNWLAFIIQHRTKAGTAWILHGVEGTGKNLFFDRLIAPIVGQNQSIRLSLDSLEDQFNQHLEEAVFVLFNEADIEETRGRRKVSSRLRELITDDTVSVRPMRGARYDARSYTNVVLASNRPVSIDVSINDRRYNVAHWQPNKLAITDAEVDAIPGEAQQFAAYLASRQVSRTKAREVIDTPDRTRLQEISGNSTDDVAQALLKGDLDFFHATLPDHQWAETVDPYAKIRHETVRTILLEATQSILEKTEHKVSRDQLHTLFAYCLDHVPASPHKFTKFLKFQGLFPVRMRKGEDLMQGVTLYWKASRDVLDDLKRHLEPQKPKGAVRRVK